jgi:hypothetical protein
VIFKLSLTSVGKKLPSVITVIAESDVECCCETQLLKITGDIASKIEIFSTINRYKLLTLTFNMNFDTVYILC